MNSLADIKQRHEEVGSDPIEAVKVWLQACFIYMDEKRRDLGREALQYLTIPFKNDPDWDKRPNSQTLVSRLKDPTHHHIFRSYAQGATPENNYKCNPDSFELVVKKLSEGDSRGYQVVVISGGADNPRTIYLKRSNTTGLFFIYSFSNVYLGVRPPIDPNKETFI